uniref:Candidate secreted effector n=1 Tax=Meloidogyne incognita TaxID=6306 RepID=A0A914KFU0_MELIC
MLPLPHANHLKDFTFNGQLINTLFQFGYSTLKLFLKGEYTSGCLGIGTTLARSKMAMVFCAFSKSTMSTSTSDCKRDFAFSN